MQRPSAKSIKALIIMRIRRFYPDRELFPLGRCRLRRGAKNLPQASKDEIAAATAEFSRRLARAACVPTLVRQPPEIDALRTKRHQQRGLADAGVIERIALHRFRTHQRMNFDPIERIVARRLPGVIIRHFLAAPPAFAALSLQKSEDRLTRGEFEGEIGRHAGGEILRLMMNDDMNVAKADAQQTAEHL